MVLDDIAIQADAELMKHHRRQPGGTVVSGVMIDATVLAYFDADTFSVPFVGTGVPADFVYRETL